MLAKTAPPKFGPLIVCERTGLPCWNRDHANLWRTNARSVCAPDDLWLMDTRTGAVTEVKEPLGISIAVKFAGHSNPRTRLGYVRGDGMKVWCTIADDGREMRQSQITWKLGTVWIVEPQKR